MKNLTLIFATNNRNKIEEIKNIIGDFFNIVSLTETGIFIDIPEPHETLEANALQKSRTIFKLTQQNCFGEDTGLEVEILNGEPGVKSARYAGEKKNFNENINKLLLNLEGKTKRDAKFRTIISLIWNEKEYMFEGTCNGKITDHQKGNNGFGYDAVFIPDGSEKTFAEMTLEEKNNFSHRRKATDKLIQFLKLL